MSKSNLVVVWARRSDLVVPTGFRGYDVCINPYVGCQFGCSYCYVRFFVKDKVSKWGDFVRVRDVGRFSSEVGKFRGKALVFGTMTDPYQPEERRSRATRRFLEAIVKLAKSDRPSRVGIFTRSPIVLDDIDLISVLPDVHVHFSFTPYPKNLMSKIEGIPISMKARAMVCKRLSDVGVYVHTNVAPAIPHVSDGMTEEIIGHIVSSGSREFFIDPMQAYKESFLELEAALKSDPIWSKVKAIMTDKVAFKVWKEGYGDQWRSSWGKFGTSKTLAVWSDHVSRVHQDLLTGVDL